MDDEVDILRKADALLSKRRPASATDFPVLTEVVSPPTIVGHIATSTEVAPPANGAGSEMPQWNLTELQDRVLARALTISNAIVSNWSDSSIHQELMLMIKNSIDKLERDVIAILSERASDHVRASVRKALELELLEIRNNRNPDKPT